MRRRSWELAVLVPWGLYFTVLFSHVLSLRPDGLYAGHEYVWSDWASVHVGMTRLFATKSPAVWFRYHPVFADGKFTYAFLTNLVSALLLRLGLPFESVFILPSIAFSLALLWGLFRVFTLLLDSSAEAFAAVNLFLLSAGFGFVTRAREAWASGDWSKLVLLDGKISAIEDHDWLEGNVIAGMLLPQRAFLLGLPLALLAVAWLIRRLNEPDSVRLPRSWDGWPGAVGAGLCVGLLPIAHMHSLIALTILLLPVGIDALISGRLARDGRVLGAFVAVAGAISSTLYLVFVSGGIRKPGFMSVVPGMGATGVGDWLWFWLRAWGVVGPLALLGLALLWRRALRPARAFFVGAFALFVLADFIQFQPTRWDNSKLFLWSYLGFCALAAHALGWLWRQRRGRGAARAASVVLALAATLTGLLETADLLRFGRHTYQMLNRGELDLADEINAKTDPLARFAAGFRHDHPVSVWAARPVLLGYVGWAQNFGFDYEPVKDDVTEIYKGTSATPELLRRRRVSYVYFSAREREDFPAANESYFREHYPLAFQTASGDERVYDTRRELRAD